MIRSLIVFVIPLLFLCIKSEVSAETCQQCISTDLCVGFKNLLAADQQRLLGIFACNNPQSLLAFSNQQYICCPNSNVVGLLNSSNNTEGTDDDGEEYESNKNGPPNHRNHRRKQNRRLRPSYPPTNYDYPRPNEFDNNYANFPKSNYNNMYPNNNYPNYNYPNNHYPNNNYPVNNNYPNNNYPNNNYPNNNYPNNNYPDNNYPDNKNFPISNYPNNNQYNMGHRNNGGNQNIARNPNIIGQCDVSTLNYIPPSPNSGCCGRDASERKMQGPNRRSAPDYNNNLWAPRSNFSPWNNNMNRPGFYSPRFKRSQDSPAPKLNITFEDRITGGIPTELEDFPWTVLLLTTFDYGTKKTSFNCGGSLISNRYVLTAAHCISETGAQVSDLEIYLAEYDKSTFPIDCKNGMDGRKCVENIVMHAENMIPHPDYDENRLQNDIALIKLRGNAPYTDFVRPICLPPFDIDNPELDSIRLFVAGWGRNGNYTSKIKQSTVINLVPQMDCKRYYSHLTPRHLCAAGYTGEDTCKGDSGGPLMLLHDGKYYLTGIVSGKRADYPCGTAVPSLYTNVFNYLDWIKYNINE